MWRMQILRNLGAALGIGSVLVSASCGSNTNSSSSEPPPTTGTTAPSWTRGVPKAQQLDVVVLASAGSPYNEVKVKNSLSSMAARLEQIGVTIAVNPDIKVAQLSETQVDQLKRAGPDSSALGSKVDSLVDEVPNTKGLTAAAQNDGRTVYIMVLARTPTGVPNEGCNGAQTPQSSPRPTLALVYLGAPHCLKPSDYGNGPDAESFSKGERYGARAVLARLGLQELQSKVDK